MSELIQYQYLDSGIHHFTWLTNSHDAIVLGSKLYRQMNDKLSSGDVVSILMDFRQSGVPSISRITEVTNNAGIRKDIHYYTAYLSDDRVVDILMRNYALINRLNGQREFFKANQEKEAIQWLLKQPRTLSL